MVPQTTTTPPTTVADLLDRAADLIERRGLCKGAYVADIADPTCPCCTDGAIRLAAGAHGVNLLDVPEQMEHLVCEAEKWVVEHIIRAGARECIGRDEATNLIETIAGWNDADTNDADSVIDTLRGVAEAAR